VKTKVTHFSILFVFQIFAIVGWSQGCRIWLEIYTDEFWFQYQFGK